MLEGCQDGVGVDGDGAVDVGFVDVAAAEGGEVADTAKDISDEKLKRCSSNGIEVGGCRSALDMTKEDLSAGLGAGDGLVAA